MTAPRRLPADDWARLEALVGPECRAEVAQIVQRLARAVLADLCAALERRRPFPRGMVPRGNRPERGTDRRP